MRGFLYGQTEYNLLKNSMHLDDYVKKGQEFGYNALSITDPNMFGHLKFYRLCIQNDIKPIIGLEIKISITREVILAYALNMCGYKNLCKISSYIMTNTEVDLKTLASYKDGIVFVTTWDVSKADFEAIASELGNVALGIGYSEYMDRLYMMMHEEGYKAYPISRIMYENKEDFEVYEVLSKIGNYDILKGEYYFKSIEELEADFFGYEDLFTSFEELVSSIDLSLDDNRVSLPKFPLTGGKSSKDYLYNLCMNGLKKRLQGFKGDTKPYFDRLNYELKTIDDMGFNDYFLIVWDFIKFAKNSGILVGPGRGSAAGSLVSYCIGISSVDPLKYNLFFERFLNPERISMPDIDTDFPDDKRDSVIEYVKNLYGDDHVCTIATFDTFKIKSAIRDLGKTLKLSDQYIDSVANQIQMLDGEDDEENKVLGLIEKVSDETLKKFLSIASKMCGLPRHISTHAAGIILSDRSLYDIIPLQSGLNNMLQTQLDAPDCESIGLLKMDFLGIRNLAIIDSTIKSIDGLNNINVFNKIPLDDKKTFEMLSRGDTLGVFQLEKKGMTRTITNLKPKRFEDIVAILALYRPGPMDNIPLYISRMHGEKVEYIHKDLEPILSETYGIIVYQEQIMQIAQKFAGYSLGEADVLRRAVSKKKEEVLVSERERFVASSTKRGYSLDVSNKIYDDIVKFANYGFNKSHSVVYALFAYTMAYLKVNYPNSFITNALTNVVGSIADTKEYIEYARNRGLVVHAPDINKSGLGYVYDKNAIYMPFGAIKGLGKVVSEEIVRQREKGVFKGFTDFKERCDLSKSINEALIFSGAFDSFKISKKQLNQSSSKETNVVDSFLVGRILTDDEYDDEYLRKMELEYLGFNLKYNQFKAIDKLRKEYKAISLKSLKEEVPSNVISAFTDIHELTTKNGDVMLVGTISDGAGSLDIVMFPRDYAQIKNVISKSGLYNLNGVLRNDKQRGRLQFVINQARKI